MQVPALAPVPTIQYNLLSDMDFMQLSRATA